MHKIQGPVLVRSKWEDLRALWEAYGQRIDPHLPYIKPVETSYDLFDFPNLEIEEFGVAYYGEQSSGECSMVALIQSESAYYNCSHFNNPRVGRRKPIPTWVGTLYPNPLYRRPYSFIHR